MSLYALYVPACLCLSPDTSIFPKSLLGAKGLSVSESVSQHLRFQYVELASQLKIQIQYLNTLFPDSNLGQLQKQLFINKEGEMESCFWQCSKFMLLFRHNWGRHFWSGISRTDMGFTWSSLVGQLGKGSPSASPAA